MPQFLIAIHKYFEAFEDEEKRNSLQIGEEKMKRQQAESLMRAHCSNLTKKCLILKNYQTILKDL